jgi:hypothetical protein
MGGGKGSKSPDPPDYAAQAKAQGAADKATAQYTTAMDRPNQYAPGGSVQWTLRPGADKNNPQAGDWQQTTSLSKEQQAIYDAQQKNDLSLQGLGSTAIGQAKDTLGQAFNPNLTDFKTPQGLADPNKQITDYEGQEFTGQYGESNTGLPQNRLNQFQNIDENTGRFSQEAADALYGKQTQHLDEKFKQSEAAERQRLMSMGLQEGSAAYTRAMDQFQRNKGSTYQTASMDSILKGYDVGSQQLSDLLKTRDSNMGLASGQYGQDAGNYALDQGERQAQFNNQASAYGLNQGERQAQFTNNLNAYNTDLAERQSQSTSELNLANQAAAQRQQQFNEQAYQRSLPINEIGALLGGSGVQMPQFANFAPSAQFNSPDLLGASQAQYNAQMGAANAGQAQKGSLLGAGAQLGGSFLGSK